MLKIYLENRIILNGDNYKCFLCHVQIPKNDFQLILKHLSDSSHQAKLSSIDEQVRNFQLELLSTTSDKKCRELLNNRITFDRQPHFFRCHVCKCPVNGLPNVLDHIKGSRHKNTIKSNINQKVDKKALCEEIPKTDTVHSSSHIKPSAEIPDCIICSSSNIYECLLCHCKVGSLQNVFQHVRGLFHSLKIRTTQVKKHEQKEADEGIINVPFESKSSQSLVSKVLYCYLCSNVLDTHSILQCHVMQHLHSEINFLLYPDIVIFKQDVKLKPIIQCSLCQMTLSNHADLEDHVKSRKHVERLAFFSRLRNDLKGSDFCDSSTEEIIRKGLKFNPSKHIVNAAFCDVCHVVVPYCGEEEHVMGKRHTTNLSKTGIATATTQKKNGPPFDLDRFYPCYACNSSFSDVEKLLNHYNGFEHQCKMTNFYTVHQNPSVNFTGVISSDWRTELNCSLCHANKMLNLRQAVDHILGKKHKSNYELASASHVAELVQITRETDCKEESPKNIEDDSQLHGFRCVDGMTKSKSNKGLKDLNLKLDGPLTVQITRSKSSKVLEPKCRKPKKIELQSNLDELVALGFSKQSASQGFGLQETESPKVDDILNGLVNLNLSKTEQRKLPLLSRQKNSRVPDSTKKMNILAQNVQNFGRSYIRFCIIPGDEYIYKRNTEKINLVHSGICLTFPYSETVRYCLVCSSRFPADQQSLFEHVQSSKHRKELEELEANHELFEDYSDQFSDLSLAKLYMQEESNDWIFCYACDVKVVNQDADIFIHKKLMNHLKKSEEWSEEANTFSEKFSSILKDVWYYAQWFTCAICKKKFDFEIEFASHLETKSHVEQVTKIKQEKILVEFDVCHICSLFWYGKFDFYDQHCNDPFHSCCVKNGNFIVPRMGHVTMNLLKNFEAAANNLVDESDKVCLENNKEAELLQIIEGTVRCQYPRAKAHAFGSRISQLATYDTDLDVFLDCEDNYMKNTTQMRSQEYLLSVQKLFENDVNSWIIDELLLSTRVPIMKLRHIPTNIKCDISFMNGLSVEKSKLLRYYTEACPLCRKLILYLKKWLTFCHLSGSDCITTFAISWLVIFYLQVTGVVPHVYYLLENGAESKVVDGWECGFLTDLPSDRHAEIPFKDHLQEFFTYYANFDYQTLALCPLIGEAISKKTFAYHEQLPEEMRSYKCRLSSDSSMIFRVDSPMCLQDPLDLSQNITKAVKKYHLRCFRQYCLESMKILSSV